MTDSPMEWRNWKLENGIKSYHFEKSCWRVFSFLSSFPFSLFQIMVFIGVLLLFLSFPFLSFPFFFFFFVISFISVLFCAVGLAQFPTPFLSVIIHQVIGVKLIFSSFIPPYPFTSFTAGPLGEWGAGRGYSWLRPGEFCIRKRCGGRGTVDFRCIVYHPVS